MIPFSRPSVSRRSVAKAGSLWIAATAGGLRIAAADTGSTLDRSRLTRTFTEDFRAPFSIHNPRTGQGRWKTSYDFGSPGGPSSRTLRDELQVYCDQAYNGINPFGQENRALTVTAAKNPAPSDPLSAGRPYTSGLLTTSMSFHQCYGYFEMRASLPQGAGLWPAFWLAAQLDPAIAAPQFPGELDVMELLGKDPQTIYCSAHWPVAPMAARAEFKTMGRTVGNTQATRSYGILWTPENLAWFVDDTEVASMRNPGLHQPMAILANLAVGGSWGGPPDPSTLFPATMRIEHVYAYQVSR